MQQQQQLLASLEAVNHALKLGNNERLEVLSIGAGAWASVFSCLLKKKYAGLEDRLHVQMWRRPGKKLSSAQASKLLQQINRDPMVLQRLRDNGQLLRYVDASLGRVAAEKPPLTADEALRDGFCDTLEGATLLPMDVCGDLHAAVLNADIIVNGVPSTNTTEVWAPLAPILARRQKPSPVVISLAKGVEFLKDPSPHILTPTRVLHRCTGIPLDRLLYFGGPNIALELWNGEYATARLCGVDELRLPLADMLSQPQLSVWHNRDVITHEVMGGLKNVYAVASGIMDQTSKHSATANSVLFSNICAEMTFITHVLSRRPETLSGPLLADTYVTMLAGRNAWYGRQLASGALTPADGDVVPGKGHIQGPSAVRAFTSLLASAEVPLGPDGAMCLALDLLPTLRSLHAVLFEGATIEAFVEGVRAESREDPSEKLLSKAVNEGRAFIPTLLVPEERTGAVLSRKGASCPEALSMKIRQPEPRIAEAFLSDDQLAALGIDAESMDAYRRNYAAFRIGNAVGARGEANAIAVEC
jgi:glycerol-3-phosphate dehydrogenase (NAD+)